ncbi:MAG: glycosyltransferase [Candidatus Solibacter usitatus]|nr:glycosyltransferase [Candidatus Solibacter usitatus]
MNFIGFPAFLLAPSKVDKWTRALTDTTFAGIHQLDWFDWLLLIPYFTLLTILAIYGAHRYAVVRGYLKYKSRIPKAPASRFQQLPRVTIQLPLFNERNVVDQLLDAVLKVRYPRELLEVQVLDDSTDDTHPYTEALVARLKAQGHPIEYIHRADRTGFKAGALQNGMALTKGDLFAVFDADFIPPADFLEKTIHFFADEKVGVVQTRWTYLNRDHNLLTEVQALMLDGHFALEHVARYGEGLFFNFNGTAGILRRRMIDEAGGWQHDTLTEDSDLSYRAQLKGWQFIYLPWMECPSELPVDTYGFQVQQQRWAKGLTQVALKLLPAIMRSNVGWREKVEAWFHLTPNLSYPLMVIVSALMLPVMMVRFYIGWGQMLLVDAPLIICSFWSVVTFYLLAEHELYPNNWKRAIFILPFLLAMGVALTISNTKAVIEALMGKQSAFVRTPKYAPKAAGTQTAVAYKRKSGWLPFAEIGMGFFFLGMTGYCIEVMNFFAMPFLSIFVCGYFWAGCSKLWQEHQARMRIEREARKVELEAVS